MRYHWRAWLANKGKRHAVVICWLAINGLLFYRTYKYYKYEPAFFYLHQMLGGWLCIARGSAAILNLNCAMLLLPMSRSLTTLLRASTIKIPGIDEYMSFQASRRSYRMLLDRCKGFHIACGYIVVGASLIHFAAHLLNAQNFSRHYNTIYKELNAASTPDEDPLWIVITSVPGVTGFLMMVTLFLILSSSLYSIRSGSYDLFWFTHRLFIVFYLLMLTHALRGVLKGQKNTSRHTPGCKLHNISVPWPEPEYFDSHLSACDEDPQFSTMECESWMWLCGPLLIYVCDSIYRYYKCHKGHVSIVNVIQHPCDVIEICLFKTGFSAHPGQYILIQCPHISSFEWHPYTVTSCLSPHQSRFSVHIKTTGDWSGKLKDYLLDRDSCGDVLPVTASLLPRLYIDGPFGSPSEDVLRYRVSVCIAGGIGITPFAALFNSICNGESNVRHLDRLYLVWLCRDVGSFLWFADLLCRLHNYLWDSNRPDILDIQLYLTSQKSQNIKNVLGDQYELLRRRMLRGRPDWKNMLSEIAHNHRSDYPRSLESGLSMTSLEDITMRALVLFTLERKLCANMGRTMDVGVFCCGPSNLNKTIEKLCSKIYTTGTHLYHYHESF